MIRDLLAPLLAFSLLVVRADVITQIPDAAPPGFEKWTSEIVLPAPPVAGTGDWAAAVAKARDFVAKLTLEEKVNLTTGAGTNQRCIGNTGTVSRLGFPGFCLQDSPLGVRLTDFVSAFPAAINTASTFDPLLIYQRGSAMGAEHRGKGINVALSPMTNLGRVAAGGRNWEGFGADPFLAGVATRQTVLGYQSKGVISCVKHFVANEQEHMRGGSQANQIYSSDVDDRTLHEVYAWSFTEAVQAGVGAIMCSYNKINQTQACQNSKLINGFLKEELGYRGFLLSDWAALINGVQPALAGTDMNMPGFKAYGQGPVESNPDNTTNSWWGSALIEAVKNGSVPEARLDDMVTRTMTSFFKLGQDKNYPAVNFNYNTEATYVNGVKQNEHVNVQGDHFRLIREIGGASTVLLKNTQKALPLDAKKIKRLAIIGSDAGPNPNGPNGCGDRGCDEGTLAMGWGSGTANFPYLIDPLSAIQAHVHDQNPTAPIEAVLNDYNYWQVTSVASQADTCLVFVNADSGEGYINVEGHAGDRNDLELWHQGTQLITVTASVCTNTIVVIHAVGPVNLEGFIENPNVTAVLSAGLPGQESGNAITDVLFGSVNPSARLPFTIAKARTDYPADVLYSSNMQTPQIVYEEALNIDYRFFDAKNITPRYEFGFGLSYTDFAYSNLNIVMHGDPEMSSSASSGNNSKNNTRRAVAGAASAASAAPAAATVKAASVPAKGSGPSAAANVTTGPAAGAATKNSTASSTVPVNGTTTTSAAGVISSPVSPTPGGPAHLFETVMTVTFEVRNTGDMDGHEASQLYLGFPAWTGEPVRSLRGFARTFVRRGDTERVTLTLREKDISIWDVVKQQWVVPQGRFTVEVGSSSRNIRLTEWFTV